MFRNESLDATHLAEFHQIEGVVADRDLSLGHLIGILHEFFRKLGMDDFFFFDLKKSNFLDKLRKKGSV